MPASFADQDILSTNTTFQNRVRQGLLTTCTNISAESLVLSANPLPAAAQTALTLHNRRAAYAAAVQGNGDNYKIVWAEAVATDATVISDATQAGTVVLTTANAAAQQALVTDAHISTAISSQFNSFFTPT
jgi:hypothetical protein